MLKKLENKSKSQVLVGHNVGYGYNAHLEVNNQNQNQLASPYQLQHQPLQQSQPVLLQQQKPQHKKQKIQEQQMPPYQLQHQPLPQPIPQQQKQALSLPTIEKIQLSKKKLREILEIAFSKLSLIEEMKKSYINLLVDENSEPFLFGDLSNHEKLEKLGIDKAGPRLKIINYFKKNRPEIKDLSDEYRIMFEEIEKQLENHSNNNVVDIQQPQQSKTTGNPYQKHDEEDNNDEKEGDDEEDENDNAIMKKDSDDNKREEDQAKDEKQVVMQREYTITSRPAVEKHYVDSKQMYVVFYINIINQ